MKLYLIMGPNGIGKTKRSIRIAKYLNAPVLVFDRFQIFQELHISSGRPDSEELEQTMRIYIAERLLEDGELGGIDAYKKVVQLIRDVSSKYEYLIIEGGSRSLWFNFIKDYISQVEDDFLIEYHYVDNMDMYIKKLKLRIDKMIVPNKKGKSILTEVVNAYKKSSKRSAIEGLAGYNSIISAYKDSKINLSSIAIDNYLKEGILSSYLDYYEDQRCVFDELFNQYKSVFINALKVPLV